VCGNLDAVTLLLDAGSDMQKPTKKTGRTALHMAAASGSAPVVQVTPPECDGDGSLSLTGVRFFHL